MSDHFIGIIPRDPLFVPAPEAIKSAREWMGKIAPEAEEISDEVTDAPCFRDCGGNLASIQCPHCLVKISSEWWSEEIDLAADSNFKLRPIELPCGHIASSLNELRYHFDQGFSRFIIEAMNPNVGRLEPSQVARFEEILGCPVRVIYQHI